MVRLFLGAGSTVLMGLGIGGIPDDLRTWGEWLGMIDHDMVRYGLVTVGLLGLAYLHKDRLLAGVAKVPFAHQRAAKPPNWQEFEFLPLKYAACMSHGFPPSERSLKEPIVQEELARLSLAVKQRQIEHRNGDTYHGLLVLMNIDPSNDQFSKRALARYAKAAGREIPAFLQSTQVPDEEGE